MNRERGLAGSNGYDRELGFHPLDFLMERLHLGRPAAWLDLCCGSGKALIEAATIVRAEGLDVEIVGVDLVGMFHRADPDLGCSPFLGTLQMEVFLKEFKYCYHYCPVEVSQF